MQVLLKSLRFLGIFLIISALVLSASGCSVQKFDTIVIKSSENYENTGNASRIYRNANTVRLASSDSAELYLDKDSGGIALISENTQKKWTSLPLFENTFASTFSAKVTDGEKIYILDSSAYMNEGKLTYKQTATGAVVTYSLKGGGRTLTLPVEFSLSGSYLEVSCNISDCILSEGLTLLSVSIMPFFGAVRYTAQDTDYSILQDYFLVPDGSGAIMYTAVQDEHSALTFSVYGKDYYEENIPAPVGAYGIIQKGAALAVTLTDGEENALIRAVRADADAKNINRIYPEFIITPVSKDKGETDIASSYNGKIAVTYEVLSRENASYTDVATSVRQTLIRSGLLSAEKCEDEYPLTLTFVASTDGKKGNTVADYQKIENILSILKGKGINEVNAVLSGAANGGLSASAVNNPGLLGSIGSRNDLRELLSYAHSQNFNVFAQTNLLTAKSSAYCEKGISGEYKTIEIKNPLSPYIGDEGFTLKYIGAKGIAEAANNILGFVDKFGFSGVCLADTAVSCHEVHSGAGGAYSAYNDVLTESLSAVSSETKLMLSGTPMNIAENADYLYNVSFETAESNTASYVAVPFVEAVIHGSVVYSGVPSNGSGVSLMNLLKSVEYGAVPHFLWVFNENSDKYYEYSLNDAVEFCLRAQQNLGDLTTQRITGHFMYEDGVYCTVYENGVRVYVNYNNYSVIIGEVSVMPYDYLRIG